MKHPEHGLGGRGTRTRAQDAGRRVKGCGGTALRTMTVIRACVARDARAYLVFHPVQTGPDGVAAAVLALLCGVEHPNQGCVRGGGAWRDG